MAIKMEINKAINVLRKNCEEQEQCDTCPFLNPNWIKLHERCVLLVNSPNHWQDIKE